MTQECQQAVGDLIANPHNHFASPEEVLARRELKDQDKLAILKAMELDARELSVATEENMAGSGDAAEKLRRVTDAMRRLENG